MAPNLWDRSFTRNRVHRIGEQRRVERERILFTFMKTNDPTVFEGHSRYANSYPNVRRLAQFLRDPTIRSILPVSIRPSIALDSTAEEALGFELNAVSPMTDLEGFKVLGSYGESNTGKTALWRSEFIPSALPMVRFKLSGTFDYGICDLRFLSEHGTVVHRPMISRSPGDRLKNVNSFVPKGGFILELEDADPQGWVAFGEVREMGFYSWLCRRIVKEWQLILISGICILFLGVGVSLHKHLVVGHRL